MLEIGKRMLEAVKQAQPVPVMRKEPLRDLLTRALIALQNKNYATAEELIRKALEMLA